MMLYDKTQTGVLCLKVKLHAAPWAQHIRYEGRLCTVQFHNHWLQVLTINVGLMFINIQGTINKIGFHDLEVTSGVYECAIFLDGANCINPIRPHRSAYHSPPFLGMFPPVMGAAQQVPHKWWPCILPVKHSILLACCHDCVIIRLLEEPNAFLTK